MCTVCIFLLDKAKGNCFFGTCTKTGFLFASNIMFLDAMNYKPHFWKDLLKDMGGTGVQHASKAFEVLFQEDVVEGEPVSRK